MDWILPVIGLTVHLGVIGIIWIAVIIAGAYCLMLKCWRDE